VIVDVDGTDASRVALAGIPLGWTEPQLALRHGRLHAPRLTRVTPTDPAPVAWPRDGAVLITGASGTLAGVVARHLGAVHGVGHMVLVSRRGPDAPGAGELVADLERVGVEARMVACDVTDPDALGQLIDDIDSTTGLSAVIHAAGVLDDALIESVTPDQLDTAHLPLTHFVLFSSAATTLPAPTQGAYAAANASLDALAEHRRARGLPAVSLGWGLWERTSHMTEDLTDAGRALMRRGGINALTDTEALALLDTATTTDQPTILAFRADLTHLRRLATGGAVPAIWRTLVPPRPPRATERTTPTDTGLTQRLHGLTDTEAEHLLVDLVRGEAARVLGHTAPDAVTADRSFGELGFDSLLAVELRNRLVAVTGLQLPATVVFDHPNAVDLAGHLDRLARPDASDVDSLLATVERLSSAVLLGAGKGDDGDEGRRLRTVESRLRVLLAGMEKPRSRPDGPGARERIEAATRDEVFDIIDSELGRLDERRDER
jgi:hypothetical protein